MKSIKIIAILAAVLLIGGCKSDKDNQDIPQELFGTWGGNKTISQTGNDRTLLVTFIQKNVSYN